MSHPTAIGTSNCSRMLQMFSVSCSATVHVRSAHRLGSNAIAPQKIAYRLVCRAESGGDKAGGGFDADFESMFAKELKRRGMEEPSSSSKETSSSSGPSPISAAKKDPFQGAAAGTKTRFRAPPPSSAAAPTELDGQRGRSMALVTEGLEGLIPRGSQLLQLGGSIFLGFLPFMLAFSVLFTCVYGVFGDSFLHGGRVGSSPRPYDPQQLLSVPTVDPYVPLR